jgi:hypothetical protein
MQSVFVRIVSVFNLDAVVLSTPSVVVSLVSIVVHHHLVPPVEHV